MHLDPEQLRRVAQLARIALGEHEIEPLRVELERVLGLVDELKSAPVDGVEPMAHPLGLSAVPRQDVVTESDRSDALLALAPEAQGGLYLVPKVIE